MAFSCKTNRVFLYDRGGMKLLTPLDQNVTSVKWGRLRDDSSEAVVKIATRGIDCDPTIGLARAGRTELVIMRGDERVWEGPVTHIQYTRDEVQITAHDVAYYLRWMIMTKAYNDSYPNNTTVLRRVERILANEMPRFEAQVPPLNIQPHLQFHHNTGDAGTSSNTKQYAMGVYEHVDTLAARSGLDYTALGRAIHFWDTHQPAMGQTPPVYDDDFMSGVVITEYGADLLTISAITDGKGRYAEVGGPDDYYGRVESVDTAYDEDTGNDWDDPNQETKPDEPSVEDMKSQAQRVLAGHNPTPLVVRVPDNSMLNPKATLTISQLVPGVWIPLSAELPGRRLAQMQKLDSMTVEETEAGESISVVMSPAPKQGSNAVDGEE